MFQTLQCINSSCSYTTSRCWPTISLKLRCLISPTVTALCDVLYKRLRNVPLLAYLLTYLWLLPPKLGSVFPLLAGIKLCCSMTATDILCEIHCPMAYLECAKGVPSGSWDGSPWVGSKGKSPVGLGTSPRSYAFLLTWMPEFWRSGRRTFVKRQKYHHQKLALAERGPSFRPLNTLLTVSLQRIPQCCLLKGYWTILSGRLNVFCLLGTDTAHGAH